LLLPATIFWFTFFRASRNNIVAPAPIQEPFFQS
jgi:hypothetical protein